LQVLLDEQKKIQAGQDRLIAQLKQQVATTLTEKDTLATQLAEIQGQAGEGQQELETLRQKSNTYEAEKADLQARVDAVALESERVKLVASKYPALAPLMEQGALPPAKDMAEFEQKLATLQQALTAQTQATVNQALQGIKPPASPPAGPTVNLDSLAKDMLAAARAGEMDKLAQLKEQWYQIAPEATKPKS